MSDHFALVSFIITAICSFLTEVCLLQCSLSVTLLAAVQLINYSGPCACLSLCLSTFVIISCVQNISKSYERILMKFCGEVGRGPGSNRLDFGGSLEPGFLNPGFRIFLSSRAADMPCILSLSEIFLPFPFSILYMWFWSFCPPRPLASSTPIQLWVLQGHKHGAAVLSPTGHNPIIPCLTLTVTVVNYLRCCLVSREGIVSLGVRLSRCVCVRRISLGSEGNVLYPVLFSCGLCLSGRTHVLTCFITPMTMMMMMIMLTAAH